MRAKPAIVGRAEQIQILKTVLEQGKCTIAIPHVFVHGAAGSGKTLVTRTVFSGPSSVHVNCAFVSSAKQICRQISEPCTNILDLVEYLEKRKKPLYVCPGKLCCLFVSRLDWSNYCVHFLRIQPILVDFPGYTKEQVLEILSRTVTNVRDGFIDLIVDIFYRSTNNPVILRKLIHLLYQPYVEPLKDKDHDALGLFDHLQSFVQQIYWRYSAVVPLSDGRDMDPVNVDILSPTLRSIVVSAYVASHTLERMDSWLFGKGKSSKRETIPIEQPRSFTLDRLFRIFQHVSGSEIESGSHQAIEMQVSRLVAQRILSTNVDAQELRLKCAVERECVEKLAKSIGIDLYWYLTK